MQIADIRIKKVAVLSSEMQIQAYEKGFKDDDLVLVRTILNPFPEHEIIKIEGSPAQFLFDRTDPKK